MGEDPFPLAFAIAPSGAVHLDARPSPESCVPAALARTFTADLARGPGFAILQLAATWSFSFSTSAAETACCSALTPASLLAGLVALEVPASSAA